MAKTNQSAGFSVFAFAWATACLFHQLTFFDWRWYSFGGIAISVSSLLVLYKPSSWQRFVLFLLVDWITVAWAFPVHPNHIVFSWVINGCLLTSFVVVAVRQRGVDNPAFASTWFEAFAPWLRVFVCILYAITVFHKINVSYFDLDWSCAASLHLEIDERIHLLPDATWALYAAVYGTLIIECLIPVLLFYKRTRYAGIILGMLFHALLALHPHPGLYSFSATMFALFTVFLSAEIAMAMKPTPWMVSIWRLALYIWGAWIFIWLMRGVLPAAMDLPAWLTRFWILGLGGFYIYFGFSLYMLVRAVMSSDNDSRKLQGNYSTIRALAFFAAIIVLNALGPYFGLRTQSSFAMFSNLHTEGGVTNHLIMPSGIQFTDWQYDLVDIIDSNQPALIAARDKNMMIVYLELRRLRTENLPDFRVTFLRKGKLQTYDQAIPATHDVLQPLNGLARRYFYFRPVEKDHRKVRCKH